MKIKTVTFDLWQTLIYETPEQELKRKALRAENINRVLVHNGFRVNPNRFEAAHKETWTKCEAIWQSNVDVSIRDQVIIYLRCLDDKIDWSGISSIVLDECISGYIDPIIKEPPFLFEDAKEVLSYLREHKINIGLICNTGRTPGVALREVFRHLQIDGYFNVLTFSNEMLIRKPRADIFLHTLNQLNTQPSEGMHIGDNPITDVIGAKGAGMKAAWVKRQDLRTPGVAPDFIIHKLNDLIGIMRV